MAPATRVAAGPCLNLDDSYAPMPSPFATPSAAAFPSPISLLNTAIPALEALCCLAAAATAAPRPTKGDFPHILSPAEACFAAPRPTSPTERY